METVSVMFYWGGNTLQDPEEGFSYDIPPQGFYEVPLPMSLAELESMLMPKVASTGEAARLRFTCRFPFRNCQNVIKYKPFPINDDESFSTLLKNHSIFHSCPEIYVRMEYLGGEEQMILSPIPIPITIPIPLLSPIGLDSFNAPAKRIKQSNQFLTSTSAEKRLPAVEIVENNMNILTKILLRVPAKSLINFKCVSKRWLSLISDSQFGSNHTHCNPTVVSGIYLYSRILARNHLSFNDRLSPVSVGSHLRSSLPTFSFLDGVVSVLATVCHSSNGLMLCCNGCSNYIVCNLTTQKFIALPNPPSTLSYHEKYLVFDPAKSPYYKVVLVSRPYDLTVCQLHIYSSESTSWKNASIPKPIMEGSRCGTIWNGAIIWRSWSRHEHVYSLLDVDTEKLTTTRVPPDPNLSKGMLYFGECSGHLLLIQLPTHDAKEFKVLEMNREDFRWTVRYRVDLRSLIVGSHSRCVISVISVVKGAKDNDITVVFYNRGKVYSRNLKCRTMKVLCELSPREISSFGRTQNLYECSYQFTESLSPV